MCLFKKCIAVVDKLTNSVYGGLALAKSDVGINTPHYQKALDGCASTTRPFLWSGADGHVMVAVCFLGGSVNLSVNPATLFPLFPINTGWWPDQKEAIMVNDNTRADSVHSTSKSIDILDANVTKLRFLLGVIAFTEPDELDTQGLYFILQDIVIQLEDVGRAMTGRAA